jgi:cell fate regulator YaaT (PSP1 superfamily)
MRNLGVFSTRQGEAYARGMQVIARTQRGMEAGEVLCEATDHVVASMVEPKNGQILREQTEEDARELRRLFEQEQREHQTCTAAITELSLPMQLIDVERLYGGERVIVYYLSEDRVDFRQLVKNLAKDFQTRIEMKQIGVRDEAKLLADYGDCGKPVCCNTHLSEMPPVSMRMAKLQKATLDPSKISGRCGRLKCCLRYEYDTYQDLQKDMAPVGSEVITSQGRARVLAQEILAGQLLIETEDMRRIAIQASDVMTVLKRGTGRSKPPRRSDDDGPNSEGTRGEGPRGDDPRNQGPRGDGPRNGGRPAPPPTQPQTDQPQLDSDGIDTEAAGPEDAGIDQDLDRGE